MEGQDTGRGTRTGSPSPDVARDLGQLPCDVHTIHALNAGLARDLEKSRREHETAKLRVADVQKTGSGMSRTAGTRAKELALVEAQIVTARFGIVGTSSQATVDAPCAAVEEVGKWWEAANANVAGEEVLRHELVNCLNYLVTSAVTEIGMRCDVVHELFEEIAYNEFSLQHPIDSMYARDRGLKVNITSVERDTMVSLYGGADAEHERLDGEKAVSYNARADRINGTLSRFYAAVINPEAICQQLLQCQGVRQVACLNEQRGSSQPLVSSATERVNLPLPDGRPRYVVPPSSPSPSGSSSIQPEVPRASRLSRDQLSSSSTTLPLVVTPRF